MARPLVAFPDAVLLVIEYLRDAMPTGTLVYSRVPETRPAEFIRVERNGGTRNSLVTDRPRLDIHCWSDTEAKAQALCELARAHVGSMAGKRGPTTVYRVREVGGPQWLPDSASGSPRYAIAVEFSTRGTDLE